jgi:hypothetical protein
MAKPRVFVSSTYYDLRHVRASLENFIEQLGYEPILSEKGDIAYSPDIPLDESCYREVGAADVFVLIIGGRYGSPRTEEKRPLPVSFYERYQSITRSEYQAALLRDLPVYIFIETAVYAEYHTFLRNKSNTDINYAHVDSVNIFALIEEIDTQPKNNPIRTFDRYEDIESWLRDQWAGLFKEFLSRSSSQKQLTSLREQVAELAQIGQTMKRYLEELVTKVSPQTTLVEESRRLEEETRRVKLESNSFIDFIYNRFGIPKSLIEEALRKSQDFESFLANLGEVKSGPSPPFSRGYEVVRYFALNHPGAREAMNEARIILGLPPFDVRPRTSG